MRLKVESRKTLQDSTVMEIAREYVCVCLSVTTVDISLEIQLKKAVTDDNSDVNSNNLKITLLTLFPRPGSKGTARLNFTKAEFTA